MTILNHTDALAQVSTEREAETFAASIDVTALLPGAGAKLFFAISELPLATFHPSLQRLARKILQTTTDDIPDILQRSYELDIKVADYKIWRANGSVKPPPTAKTPKPTSGPSYTTGRIPGGTAAEPAKLVTTPASAQVQTETKITVLPDTVPWRPKIKLDYGVKKSTRADWGLGPFVQLGFDGIGVGPAGNYGELLTPKDLEIDADFKNFPNAQEGDEYTILYKGKLKRDVWKEFEADFPQETTRTVDTPNGKHRSYTKPVNIFVSKHIEKYPGLEFFTNNDNLQIQIVGPGSVYIDENKEQHPYTLEVDLPPASISQAFIDAYGNKPKLEKSETLTLQRRKLSQADRELVLEALTLIPADDYNEWRSVGMVLSTEGFELNVWDKWSQKSDKYADGVCAEKWCTFKCDGLRIGTIFHIAKKYGFKLPLSRYSRTDTGNANWFSDNYGHLARYYPPIKNWLVWDGKRWTVDDTLQVIAYAKEAVKLRLIRANEADDDPEINWAFQSLFAAKISAMLVLARPDVAITTDQLDCDHMLLNCNNGTIDLRTGKLQPHRQEDFITKLAPVDFDENAEAPTWLKFLDDIFASSESLIEFVQRALGYSLSGSVKEQLFIILYGTGQNGKTTLVNVIIKILGDYALTTDPSLFTIKQRSTSSEDEFDLMGVRFAATDETAEGMKLDEAKMKRLTGGNPINASKKYGHNTTFNPTHKLWVDTNHLPKIKGQEYAIWRRIRLVPFNVQIPEAKRDKHLADKLWAEASSILNYLIAGCLKWQESGLTFPTEVQHATANYKSQEDTLTDFLEDVCYTAPDAQVQASVLKTAHHLWCKQNSEMPLNKNDFPARLCERGFEKDVSGNVFIWKGVGLISERDAAENEKPDNNFASVTELSDFRKFFDAQC